MFHKMINLCEQPLVETYRRNYTMSHLRCEGHKFEGPDGLDCALLAVDVHFQKSNRPEGRFSDQKHYFSGKHYQYGLKFEASVYPNGLASYVSPHYPGSTHDFEIFKQNVNVYKQLLTKTNRERGLIDNGPLAETYPSEWAILGDSAYTGAEKQGLRGLYIKKSKHQHPAERAKYAAWSKARVLVENFFGRMLNLWGIMRETYTYNHGDYDNLVSVVVSLTNYHIKKYPLRREEGEYYANFVTEMVKDGFRRHEQRQRARALYADRQRQLKRARAEQFLRNQRQRLED